MAEPQEKVVAREWDGLGRPFSVGQWAARKLEHNALVRAYLALLARLEAAERGRDEAVAYGNSENLKRTQEETANLGLLCRLESVSLQLGEQRAHTDAALRDEARQRAVEALGKWIRHDTGCRAGGHCLWVSGDETHCDCGLAAKLEELRAEAEEKHND